MFINSIDIREITSSIKKYINTNTALISVGEHTEINIKELVNSLNKNGISFIGGIFPKVIFNNATYEKGIVVSTLYNVVHLSTINNISKKQYTVSPFFFENNKNYSLITYVDGLTSYISNFLSKLYENYGMKTNYFGGGAGSLSLKQAPCIFSKDGFFEDAAVVCIMEMKSSIGVKHGWKKLEGPYIVTKAKKNIIEEINWEAPFDIYQKIVEKDTQTKFTKDNFFQMAMGYPLGIIKQGVDYIIRDPLSIGDEKALVCIGEVEENTLINVMKGDPKSLLEAAKDAAEESITKASEPKTAIIIDCISRILYLNDQFKQELENVSNSILDKHPDVSISGALTLGEISSYGNGYIEFYNKTIVVGLFE